MLRKFVCAAASLCAVAAGHAVTLTWTGAAGTSNINTAANWSPAQQPQDGDVLIFTGGTGLAPQISSPLNPASITFNSGAAAFTLGGTSTITTETAGITNNSANTETINNAIILNAAQTWTAAAGDLVFGGAINKSAFALTIDGAFNTTLNGVISSTAALNKIGTGTLTLGGTAANTNSGAVNLKAGTLVLNKSAGVKAVVGALTVGDGLGGANADVVRLNADFQILATKQTIVESSGLLDLNGHSESLGSGVTTLIRGGSIAVNGGALTVQSALTFTVGGSISTGAGTFTLAGTTLNGTTSGSVIDISGNFSLGGGVRSFVIDVGVTMNVPAIVSNGGFTKTGGGTVALTAANTYASTTTLNTGILVLGNDAALGTGTFDFSGGTVQASGAARTIANVVTITATAPVIAGALDLTFSNSITLSQNTNFTVDNTGVTTFSGAVGQDATARNFTKSGAGTLILSGSAANTHAGTTTVSAGVLNIRKDGALGTTAGATSVTSGAALELQGGITIAGETLTLNGGGISSGGALRSVSGANSWTGGITLSSATTIASDGGTLTLASITNSSHLATFTGAGNITVAGSAGTSTGSLTKSGNGTLTLAGASTYTGGTSINGGTLSISSNSALGNSSGTLTFGGGKLKTSADVTSSRAITVGAGGGTFDTDGHTVILSGAISGSAGFTKSGAGTLRISGDSPTYSGTVTIAAGTLVLSGAVGSGVFTIENGASFDGLGTVQNLTAQTGGTLTPGDAICGLLNTGNFTHQSGAHLSLEIGGTTAGAASNGYDQISVTGGITLAGDLQGSLLGGFQPTQGGLFFAIVNDGTDAISGTFASLPQRASVTFGSATFAISYVGDSAGGTFTGGNDVVLMVVPEPDIAANLGAGLALLAACARKRVRRGV